MQQFRKAKKKQQKKQTNLPEFCGPWALDDQTLADELAEHSQSGLRLGSARDEQQRRSRNGKKSLNYNTKKQTMNGKKQRNLEIKLEGKR